VAAPGGAEPLRSRSDGAEAAQLRGGTLLLVGRVLAVGIGFVNQVLIVRSLSKGDYGAFAYGLSIVNTGEVLVTLGLDRGLTRFVPIYDERGDRPQVAGTVALVLGAVAALSTVLVVVVVLLGDVVGGSVSDTERGAEVLLLLVFLAPIQAFDNLFTGLLATFGRAGSIFLRRFVLGPGLRLLVVLVLVAADEDVVFLAAGYVSAALAGVLLYSGVVVKLLRRRGILADLRRHRAVLPVREVLAFTVPLLSGDLVFVLVDSLGSLVLGHVAGPSQVATLRAVVPVARLNQLALASFGILFTPLAARRFARDDHAGVGALYWQSAAFVAVISFPVAVVTIALAGPLTVALFGDRYEDSGLVLAMLSLGYYTSSALGFNGLTLNVFGRVRAVLAVNTSAAVASALLTAVLVPAFGATGAGISGGATLVLHNLLRQVAMARATPVPAFDRDVSRAYLAIVAALAAVLASQVVLDVGLAVGIAASGLGSLVVLAAARPVLRLEEVFPAVARSRVGRLLVGAS